MKLIDRDKALSFPFANGQYDHEHADTHFILGCEAYREWLEGLPVVEPERKKGKWENYIADTGVEHWRVIRCSECGKVAIDRYNYCPHCGARMDEE